MPQAEEGTTGPTEPTTVDTGCLPRDDEPGVRPTDSAPAPRRHRIRWTALAVGVIAAILVTVLAVQRPSANQQARSTLIGRPAPPFGGPSVTPYPLASLDGLRGDWAVINFFATWCIPCQQEQPHLAAFAAEHRATHDVQLVMVIYNDSVSNVQTFLRTRNGQWPAVEDTSGQTAVSYGVAGIPETYLVDPRGVIVAKIIGASTTSGLDDLVAKAKARNL